MKTILLNIQHEATYHDGYVIFPAYLLEQLHNLVFPDYPTYEYTTPEGQKK